MGSKGPLIIEAHCDEADTMRSPARNKPLSQFGQAYSCQSIICQSQPILTATKAISLVSENL